jgi:hypothetical protein
MCRCAARRDAIERWLGFVIATGLPSFLGPSIPLLGYVTARDRVGNCGSRAMPSTSDNAPDKGYSLLKKGS